MRATQRVDLLNAIGAAMQQRYTFDEIDDLLSALGANTDSVERGGSKRLYVRDILKRENDKLISELAEELGLPTGAISYKPSIVFPANWAETTKFRLFISHISKDKMIATRLRAALEQYQIAGFVAHEDIHPTLAWQDEIERGLQTMDAMVAVHTDGFSASYWTQQEIGYALGRQIKVISFKYDEDPTGFIGKHQALPRLNRTAEQIADEIDKLLQSDPRTEMRLQEAKKSYIHNGSHANPFDDDAIRRSAAMNFFDSHMKPGVRVNHAKFGDGIIAETEGNKLEIDFDLVGRKRVLTAFVKAI